MSVSGQPTSVGDHTPDESILLVDEDYAPVPGFAVRHIVTCEAAIELLEHQPVDELWFHTDVTPVIKGWSLIDFLVGEGPWEGKSQIGVIVIFHEDDAVHRAAAEQIALQLKPFYTVRVETIDPARLIKIAR